MFGSKNVPRRAMRASVSSVTCVPCVIAEQPAVVAALTAESACAWTHVRLPSVLASSHAASIWACESVCPPPSRMLFEAKISLGAAEVLARDGHVGKTFGVPDTDAIDGLPQPPHDAHAHGPHVAALDRPGRIVELRNGLAGRARLLEQDTAGRREVDALPASNEQRDAKLVFQLADVPAQGWLGDVEPLRCAGEAVLLRHGHERPQVPEVHGGILRAMPHRQLTIPAQHTSQVPLPRVGMAGQNLPSPDTAVCWVETPRQQKVLDNWPPRPQDDSCAHSTCSA